MSERERPRDEVVGEHPSADTLIDMAFGYLDPGRGAAVLAHVSDCPRCEESLRSIVADRERHRALAAAEREPALAGQGSPARRGSRPWGAGWRLALAGALASAAVLTAVVVLTSPRRLSLEPVWMPAESAGTEQRGVPRAGEDESVWRGLIAYRAHDLDVAIPLLARHEAADQGLDRMRRIHLASALLLRGRDGEALDALAGLDLDALPHPWRGETRWVRASALARAGRRDEALAELERLARDSGDAAIRARRALASWRR